MILVFGKTGQVGAALDQFDNTLCLGRDEADFTSPQDLAEIVARTKCSAIINAVAYTAVDKAEEDEDMALCVNGEAVEQIAKAAQAKGVPFVHISTDYVFDGSGDQPRKPGDATNPINAYGRSKLAGEIAIAQTCDVYAILRTSWVFAESGQNFVNTMRRLGAERDALNVVSDQIGGPTPAIAIAEACRTMALALEEDPSKSGIYHFSGAPNCSWADFAREIMRAASLDCRIHDIKTVDYPTPAQRPLNSRLDCDSSLATFAIHRPNWSDYLG